MQNMYKNLAFWSWNEKMQDEELINQINSFAVLGYGGFFMHARAGLKIDYLGKQWFNAVKVCLKRASELSLDVYIYDEQGWPSGFAGGLVNGLGADYQQKSLFVSENADNALLEFSYKNKKYFVNCKVNPYYVDLLNRKVTNAFIDCTHNRYKKEVGEYFASTIKAVFTDESQLGNIPYSYELNNLFHKTYVYELIPNLYKLFFNTGDYKKFRYDYYNLVQQTMTNNFVRPIADWCESNGLMMSGHFPCEDSLSAQTFTTGGVMPKYAYMQAPAIDFLGRRLSSLLLLKQISSVNNQLGKKNALSETFGCTGWGIKLKTLCYIYGYQAVHGINKACTHLNAYSIKGARKRDYPSFFSYQQPYFEKLDCLIDYMENLNEFCSLGTPVNDVLVLSPLKSFYIASEGRQLKGASEESEDARQIANIFRLVIEGLEDVQIPFDIGDEELLKDFALVDNGTLNMGKMRYKVILLPKMITIDKSTIKLLKEVVKENIKIFVIGALPTLVEGEEEKGELDFLREFLEQFPYGGIIHPRAKLLEKFFQFIGYERKFTAFSVLDRHLVKDISISLRQQENEYFAAIFNKSDADTKTLMADFSQKGKVVIIDPITKIETPLPPIITLLPMQTLLIKQDHKKLSETLPKYFLSTKELRLKNFTLLSDNILSIDKAQISFDNINFGKKMDIIKVQEEVYKSQNKKVYIKYMFNSNFSAKVKLAVESEDVTAIWFNDKKIDKNSNDYFIDKAISVIEIGEVLPKNEVVLQYDISVQDLFDENVFETERNKFFFDKEIEAIYILGKFDVYCDTIHKNTNSITTNNDFYLSNVTEKNCLEELTAQGLLFYRGKMSAQSVFNFSVEGEVTVSIKNGSFTMACVLVNGKEAGAIFTPSEELDITKYVKIGENQLEFIFYTSNRNTLGAFHHYKKEPNFVGISTFNGIKGYEDELVNFDAPLCTYVDEYNFIPLEIGQIFITVKEKVCEK